MPRKPTTPMPNHVHHTFEGGGIALWHITETADELYALLGTTKYDTQLAEKKNDARRAEWLAVRLLIKYLFGPDAEVAYHPTGRPYLKGVGDFGNSRVIAFPFGQRTSFLSVAKNLAESHDEILHIIQDDMDNNEIFISISHTRGYAAVAYSTKGPIGLDIEHISDRVERIADRFTSPAEAEYIDTHEQHERMLYHLINWSAKETLYKLFDSPSMAEFKEVFHIAPYALAECGTMNATVCNAEKTLLAVSYRTFPEFVCTWAVSREL